MSEDPMFLNREGMAALHARAFLQAAELFRRAAAADPKAPVLWINVATACRQAEDFAGEREALEQVLTLDQTDFAAHLRLAEWHERHGSSADAATAWRAVLAFAPPLEVRTAELSDRLAHAARFIEAEHAALAGAVDAGIGAARAAASSLAQRRFGAAVDYSLGRRAIYANECAGMFYPFLPADEYFDRELFPWFEALEAETEAIRDEFLSLRGRDDAGFAPYVRQAPGTPQNRWTPLDGSADWSSLYLFKYGVRDERVCALCPRTAAAIEALPRAHLPGRAPTAFFSVLAPHSRIPPHTGVTNTRAIIHLPLIVPEGCGFRVGAETRAWQVGEAFAFDDTIEHEAWNDSDHPRAILILDVWNPHLTDEECALIAQFYAVADASGHRPVMPDVAA